VYTVTAMYNVLPLVISLVLILVSTIDSSIDSCDDRVYRQPSEASIKLARNLRKLLFDIVNNPISLKLSRSPRRSSDERFKREPSDILEYFLLKREKFTLKLFINSILTLSTVAMYRRIPLRDLARILAAEIDTEPNNIHKYVRELAKAGLLDIKQVDKKRKEVLANKNTYKALKDLDEFLRKYIEKYINELNTKYRETVDSLKVIIESAEEACGRNNT